jgi:hypothetical protein
LGRERVCVFNLKYNVKLSVFKSPYLQSFLCPGASGRGSEMENGQVNRAGDPRPSVALPQPSSLRVGPWPQLCQHTSTPALYNRRKQLSRGASGSHWGGVATKLNWCVHALSREAALTQCHQVLASRSVDPEDQAVHFHENSGN